MVSKNEIIDKAYDCGFGDIGFTTAEPFEIQKKLLQERLQEYELIFQRGLDLMAGTDPKQFFPQAKSIIVLMEVYFNQAFPPASLAAIRPRRAVRVTREKSTTWFISANSWLESLISATGNSPL